MRVVLKDEQQLQSFFFFPAVPKVEEEELEEEEEDEAEEKKRVLLPPPRLDIVRISGRKKKKRARDDDGACCREVKKEKRRKKKPKYEIKIKEEKEEEKAMVKCEVDDGLESGRSRGSSSRWSVDRYERAELKLIEIVREKGGVRGSPLLRKELREEARKHIGDTGLLDHLLKHTAGKVVGGDGALGERFMRKHNANGAMVYWLEPAGAQLQLEDGNYSACGAECKEKISQLKELVGVLNRYTYA